MVETPGKTFVLALAISPATVKKVNHCSANTEITSKGFTVKQNLL